LFIRNHVIYRKCVTNLFTSIRKSIRDVVQRFTSFFRLIWDSFRKLPGKIAEGIKSIPNVILSALTSFRDKIINLFLGIINKIREKLPSWMGGVESDNQKEYKKALEDKKASFGIKWIESGEFQKYEKQKMAFEKKNWMGDPHGQEKERQKLERIKKDQENAFVTNLKGSDKFTDNEVKAVLADMRKVEEDLERIKKERDGLKDKNLEKVLKQLIKEIRDEKTSNGDRQTTVKIITDSKSTWESIVKKD